MRSRSFKLSRDHKWTRQHVSKKYEKTYFQNIIDLLKVVAMSLLFLLDKVWRLLRKTGEMKLARKDVWFTVDDLRLYIMIILFKIDWIKTVSNVKKGRNANQWPTNAIVLGADEYMTSGERLNNCHGFIDFSVYEDIPRNLQSIKLKFFFAIFYFLIYIYKLSTSV